jgi:UTP--glucose-1-phosphate uridylyltransferase
MQKVRKAIIPAAGLGTRFLPATKAMPKEMLPIVDKPTIQYIVEEAIESGIEDIIIVTGKGKRAIEDHFDHAFELEQRLFEKGNLDLLDKVRASSNMVDIHYIRQKEPKGLGHAVWSARKFIGDEPFAVLLGDDIVDGTEPCIKQLIEQHYKTSYSIVGVQKVPIEETHRYGIVDHFFQEDRLYQVKEFVEKPAKGNAPSNLAIMGRYILQPDIFSYLENHEIGADGEVQLTDAIQRMNQDHPVFAYEFEGTRYDVGEKLGFILSTIEFALKREELRDDVLNSMKKIIERDHIFK